MKNIIIGTAGHIDHGKTSLIEAMTGYNGDELPQEKERGITIDLSFSNMERGDANVAFIDVPGHEKLIKNMISGAFGFDAALLVIDAKEGIMPQTKEHLSVLKIVGVKQIIVALTKSDLVNESVANKQIETIQEWFAKNYAQGELLGIYKTSIYDANSIQELKDALFAIEPRKIEDAPFFRYYIDRVFTLRGIGTVVTGTVLSGVVHIGDKLNVAEKNKPATVKDIQVHNLPVKSAHIHQRTALNLSISHTELSKGFLLVSKGYFRGFSTISGTFEPIGEQNIPHNAEVLFITGSKRVEGKVLLDDSGHYVTFKLKEKVFAEFNDPYVVLLAGRVVGGGHILAPVYDPLRKKTLTSILQALENQDFHKAFNLILSNHRHGFGLISSYQRFALSHEEAIAIAKELKGVLVDEKGLVIYPIEAQNDLKNMITTLYEKNPRALLSALSIVTRAKWASEWIATIVLDQLVTEGFLQKEGSLYVRINQDINKLELQLEDKVYTILESQGLTPEAPYNLYDKLDLDRKRGDQILKKLTASRKVIRLAHNLFITENNLKKALQFMREYIETNGYIDVQSFKAETDMSRKYCISYLEYLDKSKDIVNEKGRRMLKYRS